MRKPDKKRKITLNRPAQTSFRNWWKSHARAKDQCLIAVAREIPSTLTAWSILKPAKKRSFTRSALTESSLASIVRASSSAISSSDRERLDGANPHENHELHNRIHCLFHNKFPFTKSRTSF